jgi:hypothetical protein
MDPKKKFFNAFPREHQYFISHLKWSKPSACPLLGPKIIFTKTKKLQTLFGPFKMCSFYAFPSDNTYILLFKKM